MRRKRRKVSFWAKRPIKKKITIVTKTGRKITFYPIKIRTWRKIDRS